MIGLFKANEKKQFRKIEATASGILSDIPQTGDRAGKALCYGGITIKTIRVVWASA